MIYSFLDCQLDLGRFELRRNGEDVPVEPQVFALLTLLAENHERMVSRDEIVERVWEGRIVSEAAISSRIKAARRAVGDDGDAQRVIRTVHGRGFRFVAEVRLVADLPTVLVDDGGSAEIGVSEIAPTVAVPGSIPSVAVLPFAFRGESEPFGHLSEAVPHEVINALSRLRWLKVIARGSSFRFRELNPDVTVAGRALGARYCLTGYIQLREQQLSISVELADTSAGGVIWADTFDSRLDDIYDLRAAIASGVVAALETYVPMNEARLARARPPESLDAWAVYHLGVQRMLRFSRADNAAAIEHFTHALALEPELARAFAGLSFAQFQNAYHGFSPDRDRCTAEAREHAERAVALDPLDPFANFTLGRAHWLEGELEASLGWLDRGTALSPSYAHCVYARGFADTMLGNTGQARPNLVRAMELSPLDPFLYAMKGTMGVAAIVDGDYAEAVKWLDRAARTPGSPAVVSLVAATAHALDGDSAGARLWVGRARRQSPWISLDQFYKATPLTDHDLRKRLRHVLGQHWDG